MLRMGSIALLSLVLLLGAAAMACGNDASTEAGAPDEACPEGPQEVTDGLTYVEVECGDGDVAEEGDTVSVHYTGTLEDGTEFGSSVGGEPFEFTIGAGGVIDGWDRGVPGMRAGGTRELTIGPDLAYGDSGAGGVIPPGATLTFEIELLEITSAGSS